MSLDLIVDPLRQGFMQRALVAGTLVGAVGALLGVFVVQRGLAFLSDGLAHAAFGGVALGLLLGAGIDHSIWVALPFTVAVSLGISGVPTVIVDGGWKLTGAQPREVYRRIVEMRLTGEPLG